MAEDTTPPADATPEAAPKVEETAAKSVTMTQTELDQMIQDRALRETKAKYSDYDELKAKAAQVDAAEEQKKTDLEKANEARRVAEESAASARAEVIATRRETAIQLEASKQGADTDLVFAVLANSGDITIEDGKVVGVPEAVTKLLEAKPHLKIGATPRSSPTEFGGNDGDTVKDRIRQLEQKGDRESRQEAIRLKIEQGLRAG